MEGALLGAVSAHNPVSLQAAAFGYLQQLSGSWEGVLDPASGAVRRSV